MRGSSRRGERDSSSFRAAVRGAVGIAVNGEARVRPAWSSEGNTFSLTDGH